MSGHKLDFKCIQGYTLFTNFMTISCTCITIPLKVVFPPCFMLFLLFHIIHMTIAGIAIKTSCNFGEIVCFHHAIINYCKCIPSKCIPAKSANCLQSLLAMQAVRKICVISPSPCPHNTNTLTLHKLSSFLGFHQ